MATPRHADETPEPERREYSCPAWLAARFPDSNRLSLRRFVELALYEPGHGYYERGRDPIGAGGDFITGSSLHPAFARAIARIAGEVAEALGGPTFAFVEIGAGSGAFLENLAAAMPNALRGRTRIYAVERSAAQRARIAERQIEPAPQILAQLDELPASVQGLGFSYELYDAFPFHRLLVQADGALADEIVVLDRATANLRIATEPAPSAVVEALASLRPQLEPGQELELAPGAEALHATLAARFHAGMLLTFDYGARERALYSPLGRFRGTAQAHIGHTAHRGLLERPGEQDLTAHVNFSALERAGASAGFATRALMSQARLLLAAGLGAEIEAAPDAETRRAIARLIEPEGMGDDLRALVQTKGIDAPLGVLGG